MDKTKIIEGASRLVAKGAYDKAIKEYRRILDADPGDVRVLQKMGELYQKKNDPLEAANYFTQVAESYASDGFFLKAVALYKQVLKLDPSLVDINLKLGELHQQLQLLSEATAYYHLVAQNFEKAGNVRASLDMLHKILELDPENVSSRIKLGELYARQDLKAEAAEEFRRAAENLKRNSRTEEYQRVMERLSSVEPGNLDLARDVAQGYLAKGDAKHAVAKLQACFQADPTDVQTLTLLAETFQGMGQPSKTTSIYKELAKIYTAQNRPDQASQIWAKIRKLDPNEASNSVAQEIAPHPVSRGPSGPPPLPARPAGSPAAPSSDGGPKLSRSQVSQLLTETNVYVKYGLHDKSLEHLRKIFASDPENLDAHEKAYEVYAAASQPARAKEQLLNVLRLCTRLGTVERAQPYLRTILEQDPNHPEVTYFLSVLGDGTASVLSEPDAASEDAILLEASSEEIIAPEPSSFPTSSDQDLALLTASDALGEEIIDEHESIASFEDAPEDGSLVIPIDDVSSQDESAGEQWEVADPEPTTSGDFAAYELELEDADTGDQRASPDPVESAEKEECDEAEFFLEQGLVEEAHEILQTVLIAYPDCARAQELLDRAEQLASEQGVQPADSHQTSSSAEEGEAFDLAAELASELQTSEQSEDPAVAEDFQYSVDEVFAEFKKGLEKVVHPEDVDTHYDLGIAYREMGLVEDAIAEFTVAHQGCLGEEKEINCLMMIALLQKTNGAAAQAVETYKHALLSEHAVGDMKKALEFELGVTWESLGSPGKALYHYTQVLQMDSNYRDLSKIVARLARHSKPEPDPALSTVPGSGSNGVNGAPERRGLAGLGENAPVVSQKKAPRTGRV